MKRLTSLLLMPIVIMAEPTDPIKKSSKPVSTQNPQQPPSKASVMAAATGLSYYDLLKTLPRSEPPQPGRPNNSCDDYWALYDLEFQ